MSLSAGVRLGSYEIIAPLGAGGMGEVYRARDTQLHRDVAIKILPDAFASDGDRVARFTREAQTLAALNHPHIAQIYGLEQSPTASALVMELVEGEDLAERIARGAIPIDEALAIARQIAEALEAAHEQGIIHRDLKPANIKLRADGTVKVLDFGLAKTIESAAASAGPSSSPTITTPAMTRAGMILGTAAYMSPEQARGKPVDRRADLWALGAVLYEMLTGGRAFGGDDVGEVLATVVKSDVDWNRLPPATPAGIRTLLRRCLRKDPRQRLGDAGAVRIEIDEALAAPVADEPSQSRWRAVPLYMAALVAIAAGVFAWTLAVWLRTTPAPTQQPLAARLTLPLPRGTELTASPVAVISPDGAHVAYGARRGDVPQLFLRALKGTDARAIAGAAAPFFSPDSKWLGFFSDGKLRKASTTGGGVVTLADAPGANDASWSVDDTIVFATRSGLFQVSGAGGAVRPLTTPDRAGVARLQHPEFLPGGESLLVTSTPLGSSSIEDASIDVLTIDSGERKVLIQGGYAAAFLSTGHLIYQRTGSIMAVGFDPRRLEIVGNPVKMIDGLRQPFSGLGAFSCSRGGTCIYVAGPTTTEHTVTLVDRSGTSRPLPLPPRNYAAPRFSPKGDKVAFWMETRRCDIEVYDIARGSMTRLTSENDNHFPMWTPDGLAVTYISGKAGAYEVMLAPANGGGSEERFSQIALNLEPNAPLSWSRDRQVLAVADRGDIVLVQRSAEPRAFVSSRFTETLPAFSPDGRWLAYQSDESGRFEVYVQPFPGAGEKYPVSTDGGIQPVWSRDGRELFFRHGDELRVVSVDTRGAFKADRPRVLFTGSFVRSDGRVDYDVSADGQHFLMLKAGDQDGPTAELVVLLNWAEELKRLVPTR